MKPLSQSTQNQKDGGQFSMDHYMQTQYPDGQWQPMDTLFYRQRSPKPLAPITINQDTPGDTARRVWAALQLPKAS